MTSRSRSHARRAERMRADYVIGCDGGRSSVRKGADIGFEGFTYPERYIKIATPFDIATLNRNLVLRNYFSDPFEWCNLFKVRGEEPGGLWRAIFPLQEGEDEETALRPEQVKARLQKFFPKPGRYETRYVNVYGVHQRVASTFRLGRVLLAGEMAHLNNPIGGMGMNGGIHDGINLAEKLARVIHGEAGDELLDLYSRQRRHAAVKYVQAQTIANKRLMEERDPAGAQDEFRRAAAHRRQPRDRQGLYAPRRAVRQPARRRRGDLTGLRRAGGETHILRTVTPIRLRHHRTGEAGGPRLRRIRRASHPSDRPPRRHRAVARRQDCVHHGTRAWTASRRPLSGIRSAFRWKDRRARLSPQPDDTVPRFAYEAHLESLIKDRQWPNPPGH